MSCTRKKHRAFPPFAKNGLKNPKHTKPKDASPSTSPKVFFPHDVITMAASQKRDKALLQAIADTNRFLTVANCKSLYQQLWPNVAQGQRERDTRSAVEFIQTVINVRESDCGKFIRALKTLHKDEAVSNPMDTAISVKRVVVLFA